MKFFLFSFCFLVTAHLFSIEVTSFSDSGDVEISWELNSEKYVSVFHAENLDSAFLPVANFYKVKNLNQFTHTIDSDSGFFQIRESDFGTVLSDFFEQIANGDGFNMIPGSRVRTEQVSSMNSSSLNISFSDYWDILLVNSFEFFQIENDGDFIFGNYSIMPPTNDLSGTINFSNVKAYFKPGSRTEFLEDFSEILVFDPSSPLKIVSSYPDPDPVFSANWTINEEISFFYSSGKMADHLLNRTLKVYLFNESSDSAGYVEISFDSNTTGTILLASGVTPISYTFNQLTHSSASLEFNGFSDALGKSFNVNVKLYSKDADSGFFHGTSLIDGVNNQIYGYYGEDSMPVDHLYNTPIDQIVILNDQNNDGLVTQEDAEIFMANNSGIRLVYPSLGSLPSLSDYQGEFPIVETPYEDDPSIVIVSPIG
jgi:hypothetical protein